MKRRQQALSLAAAMALWAGAASAAPPEPDGATAEAPAPVTWIVVDARNHASGANGLSAVVFGVSQERGRSRPANLRVDCFDGVTTVRLEADGLRAGPAAVAVRHSLDGGRFAAAAWQGSADGAVELSGDRAIAFASKLYSRTELRLAVVRPLSVPFLFTFAVDGAEASLRPLADRCHWSGGPAISDAGR